MGPEPREVRPIRLNGYVLSHHEHRRHKQDLLTPRDFFNLINIGTGKIIALFLISVCATLNGLASLSSPSRNSCDHLVSSGDPGQRCILFNYTRSKAEECLKLQENSSILFIGNEQSKYAFDEIKAFMGNSQVFRNSVKFQQENLITTSPSLQKGGSKIVIIGTHLRLKNVNAEENDISYESKNNTLDVSGFIEDPSTTMINLQTLNNNYFDDNSKDHSKNVRIFLNVLCNNRLKLPPGFCCANRISFLTNFQLVWLLFIGVNLTIGLIFMLAKCKTVCVMKKKMVPFLVRTLNSQTSSLENPKDLSIPLSFSRLSLLLLLVFICNGTACFDKGQKSFSFWHFSFSTIYLMVFGFFFTQSSNTPDNINRDQANEYRGWLQLIILIFQVTGVNEASSMQSLYNVLFSTFIFVCASEHAWHCCENDFNLSWHKFNQEIFRLNFLHICICYLINIPYQETYFVLQLTFCYVFEFIVLRAPPKAIKKQESKTKSLLVLAKIILCIILVQILRVVLAKSSLNWHHWSRYLTSSSFGLLYGHANRHLYHARSGHVSSSVICWRISFRAILRIIIAVLCAFVVITLSFYLDFGYIFARTTMDMTPLEEILMILSIFAIRDVLPCSDQAYSAFFAWLGSQSLEMLVLQNHIWLSSLSKGIIIFIPGYSILNAYLGFFLLVCCAHEAKQVTRTLICSILPTPNNPKLSLKSFTMTFVLVLTSIHLVISAH